MTFKNTIGIGSNNGLFNMLGDQFKMKVSFNELLDTIK